MNTITRREMLRLASIAGTASLLPASAGFGFVSSASAQGGVRIRRDVSELDINDPIIVSYKKSVEEMRRLSQLDQKNPIGWVAQARIHQDFCPHGNWFFLPWHRAYIHYFESICRKLSKNPDFALPYWDWTKSPQIPTVFWGDNNPLRHPRRADATTAMPEEFVGQRVITDILATPDFQDFASYKSSGPRGGGGETGGLEGRPHNSVHSEIGGDMQTYMSPLDPIFWLHHCNIDRLWSSWNAMKNANTNDPDWTGFIFNHNFVDASGVKQDTKISALLSTDALGYRYDRPEGPPTLAGATRPLQFQTIPGLSSSAPIKRKISGQNVLSTELTITNRFADLTKTLAADFQSKVRIAHEPQTLAKLQKVTLFIRGLKAPATDRTYVRVFINCDYLTRRTPINDPHYVGTIAFFVDPEHRQHVNKSGLSFALDITNTLNNLRRAKRFPENRIVPQLLAVGPGAEKSDILDIDGQFEVRVQEAKL